jgi:hypothetical protein
LAVKFAVMHHALFCDTRVTLLSGLANDSTQ